MEKKSPGPGTYKEVEKAKAFTLRKTIDCKIAKSPKKSFIDIYKERRKWVPAPSTYKVEREAFDSLSKSPVAMRIKRH